MIDFALLDKDKKIVKNFTMQACFAPIVNSRLFLRTKYIHYRPTRIYILTEHEINNYLNFIRNISIFKPLLKQSNDDILTNGLLVDVDKVNGVQAFTILTLIRVMEENPHIATLIGDFKPHKRYNYSRLAILKMAGLKACAQNYLFGHWINYTCKTYTEGYNKDLWNIKEPVKTTGLIPKLYETFKSRYNLRDVKTEYTRTNELWKTIRELN